MPRSSGARAVTKVFGGGLLRKKREAVVALDDFSFTLGDEPPTITAIAGESGSGKTTLAHLLLGLMSRRPGQVLYRGQDVTSMSGRERMPSAARSSPSSRTRSRPSTRSTGRPRPDDADPAIRPGRDEGIGRALIEEALEMVGLRPEETLGRYPHQLSGGQRQRIMVARALLLRPRVILADEPVSMVDASLRATILASLQRLNRELGISVIYITHDLTTAYQICDNIIVLYRGSVAEGRRRRWTGRGPAELDSPARGSAGLRVRAALPIGDGGLLAATATVLSVGQHRSPPASCTRTARRSTRRMSPRSALRYRRCGCWRLRRG